MYWEEDNNAEPPVVTEEVIDLVFGIDCRCLPVDHAYDLAQAILTELPWLADEPQAGVHGIHGAASGNGWVRPDDPQALILLSRRTRFVLRVPQHRLEDARRLEGRTLQVADHALHLQAASVRPLSTLTTLFTRYLATEKVFPKEEQVLDWAAGQLGLLDIHPRKMLCGTEHIIGTPHGNVRTRSLMIADLEFGESLRLQQQGLGPHRLLGCGLFIPHKGIQSLSKE